MGNMRRQVTSMIIDPLDKFGYFGTNYQNRLNKLIRINYILIYLYKISLFKFFIIKKYL